MFSITSSSPLAGQPTLPLPPTDPRYLEGGSESRIPDVVGDRLSDARAELEGGGWTVTSRDVDNRAPKGTVIGQTPRGAALPGQPVTLQISSGSVPPPPPAPAAPNAGPPTAAPPAPGGR